MRNQTLKRLNIFTVLLLVVAVAITCCAFFIGNGIKSVVDSGNNGSQVDMSISDKAILTQTYGELPADEELLIPEGYTEVKITNQVELKAFLTDTDTTTLKYGYLAPVDADNNPTDTVALDWESNGSTAILPESKILDGRGYFINLDTVGTANGNFNRVSIDKANTTIATDIRAGGMFVAVNLGKIVNVQFNFAKAVSFKCNQEWTTEYGIIAGFNGGTIQNISLDIQQGASFKVDKNGPGSNTSNTDQCTVLVGAVAGLSGGGQDGYGIIRNASVDNKGELWAQARYKGIWYGPQGSSRSSIALLAGRIVGEKSLVENCIVSGTGKISASSTGSGSAGSGALYRNVATAVAMNSAWAGSTTQGTINGIIDAYTGEITASTSNNQGYSAGTFDSAENVYNIYRPMSRGTSKWLMNCGCDHNKTNTYKTLESKGVALEYGFSQTAGEVKYSTKLTDEQKVANVQLFEHSTSTSTVSNYVVTSDKTVLSDYTNNINTDTVGTILPDTFGNVTFSSVSVTYFTELSYSISNISATEFVYSGNVIVPSFDLNLNLKHDSSVYEVNSANVKYVYTKDGQVSSSVLPGSYKGEIKDTAYNNVVYFEEKDGNVYLATLTTDSNSVDYNINRATITVNEADDIWYKDFTYTINTSGLADNAIDKMKYSVNGGEMISANGTSLKVTANGSAVSHKFVGYKGDVQVTEEYTVQNTLKFDNTVSTYSNVLYNGNADQAWTTGNVEITFDADDDLSGLASVVVTSTGAEPETIVANNGYAYTMTEDKEYTYTLTDNIGNVTSFKVTPLIDRTDISMALDSTYYQHDGQQAYVSGERSYTTVTLKATMTTGKSGGTFYIGEVVDGQVNSWETWVKQSNTYTKVFATDGTFNLRIKLVNGAGVEKTQDITVYVQRYAVEFTNDNLIFEENGLIKVYDTNDNVTSNITLQNVFADSNPMPEEFYNHFTVTAKYSDKIAGENKSVYYTLTVDPKFADQYNISNKLEDTTDGIITKKDVYLTINQQSREFYDANPAKFSYSIAGILNNEDSDVSITLQYNANNNSSVGTYDINFVGQSSANYNVVLATENEEKGKFSITRRNVIVEFRNYAGLKYNGQEQYLEAFYTDINGNEIILDVSYDKTPINAGNYVATAIFPEDSNYKSSIEDTTWAFKIAKTTIDINSDGKVVDYDGTAKEIAFTADGMEDNCTILYNGSQDAPINAGRYVVEIKFAGDDNFNAVTKEAVLVINKTTFQGVIGFESKQVTYDGNEHALSITGAPEGTTVVYKYNNQVNVGEYQVEAVIKNVNYNDITMYATLTINKKVFSNIGFKNKTVVYDGNAHSVAVTGLPEGASVTYSIDSMKNAGSYKVTATITGDNYVTATMHADLIIEKAEVPEFAFNDTNSKFTYDGTERTFELVGDLTGFDVQYMTNVVSNAGVTLVRAIVSSPNHKEKIIAMSVTVSKVKVAVTYIGVPTDNLLKPGEALPVITASYVDIYGNVIVVDTMVDGDLSDGYVKITPMLGRNYEAIGGFINIDVDDTVTGSISTGAIIGASVGGSVGGLAVIGGIVAFFVIKKKKSIV